MVHAETAFFFLNLGLQVIGLILVEPRCCAYEGRVKVRVNAEPQLTTQVEVSDRCGT